MIFLFIYRERQKVTEELYENADIIVSTLNSTMNNQMENHFVKKTWRHIIPKNHRPFNICIMDEASQCVEPEALIPLKLGFMKLVMVGDPGKRVFFWFVSLNGQQNFHRHILQNS